jgi:hypothetical protein
LGEQLCTCVSCQVQTHEGVIATPFTLSPE